MSSKLPKNSPFSTKKHHLRAVSGDSRKIWKMCKYSCDKNCEFPDQDHAPQSTPGARDI